MDNTTTQLTITPLRPLGRDENRHDIDSWWTKVKIHLKGTIYKDVMVKTWTAKDINENRGFIGETTLGSKTHTPYRTGGKPPAPVLAPSILPPRLTLTLSQQRLLHSSLYLRPDRTYSSTCGNIVNHVKLSLPVLGPGHGPLLREDVAAAAIRPTLQGKETSPKMWK